MTKILVCNVFYTKSIAKQCLDFQYMHAYHIAHSLHGVSETWC